MGNQYLADFKKILFGFCKLNMFATIENYTSTESF